MARNKAIFDADILINMVKTKSLDFLISMFDQIYVSNYVWEQEIKNQTDVMKMLSKLKNKGYIILLEYEKLTVRQQEIYRQAYELLKKRAPSDLVNEGERVTASFAKAHSVSYYMSDDNKAAPYIKSLTEISVINYCDLLFMMYSINNEELKQITKFYEEYIKLFDKNCLPKTIRDKNGQASEFANVMAKSFDKFNQNKGLDEFLKLLKTL